MFPTRKFRSSKVVEFGGTEFTVMGLRVIEFRVIGLRVAEFRVTVRNYMVQGCVMITKFRVAMLAATRVAKLPIPGTGFGRFHDKSIAKFNFSLYYTIDKQISDSRQKSPLPISLIF